MLQQLRLENFKGLKKAEINFGRITVLIGPNGTGKSSISHALMALRQSIGANELIVTGSLINLGNFADVLNKEVLQKQVGVGLSVGMADCPDLGIIESASYSCNAYFSPQLVSLDAMIGGPGKVYFVAELSRRGKGTVQPENFMKRFPSGEVSITLGTHRSIANPLSVVGSSQPGGLDEEVTAFAENIDEYLSAIERLLNNTYHVPAIRGLEQPDYLLVDEPNIDITPGQNARLASTFAYAGRDVEEIVSIWSESITGSELSPVLVPGKKVGIKSYAAPGGIPVISDGFGTNQLVHLLLTLAITPKHSIVTIEEPEIHLHPKAQEKLCDILVEVAKAQDKQLVITTHSEHVLYAFVSAVKNGTLTRDELAIYYFEEKDKEPYRVEQDEYGDIYDWGKNFFSLP